jgi:hypothetical protein
VLYDRILKITVLGGNCHQAGNKEKRVVKARSHKAWSASKQLKDKVVIKLAHFDQDAGIIGAALLVR